MQIIDGRKIRDTILEDLKNEINSLSFRPAFSDVLVGKDYASQKYVKMKRKIAERIGIEFIDSHLPNDISTDELIQEVHKLNKTPNMCGLIVQLPLPKNIDKYTVLNAIDPKLDVDCLGSYSSEKFYGGENISIPPTALACLYILDSLDLDLKDKNIVILGKGDLVGKPVSFLLKNRGLKVISLDQSSESKNEVIKNADVIISGIGRPNFIKGEMLKKSVILIDAGTSESNGSLSGDVDMESIKNVASVISPVPGGVGPVTIAMLFKNVLKVAKELEQSSNSNN